ncbi:hypothetical protein ACFL2Q_01445 [Thermodesulfobacteriota bacterium]
MKKTLLIALCLIVMATLNMPVFAAGSAKEAGTVYRMSSGAYDQGAYLLSNTGYRLTEIARNAFGLFNPCLDLVKGTTKVVLYPIEKPLSLLSKPKPKKKRVVRKRKAKKAEEKIPQPKKPEMPKTK